MDQRRRIDEDFNDYDDADDSDGEANMLKMFAPAINGMLSKTNSPQTPTPTPPQQQQEVSTVSEISFSDAEIEEIYKALPQVYKTVAKTMSDQQIAEFIKGKYPAISSECLIRAIARVKR
jgi:hypothetical protein